MQTSRASFAGWQFVCALTTLPSGETSLAQRHTLTKAGIHLLAQRAMAILVSAYDGEGYLLWRPTLACGAVKDTRREGSADATQCLY
jgi:hypothetical protein